MNKKFYRVVKRQSKGRNGISGKQGRIFISAKLIGKRVKITVLNSIKIKKHKPNLHYPYGRIEDDKICNTSNNQKLIGA